MKFIPKEFQKHTIDKGLSQNIGLVFPMGMGKTATALSIVEKLMLDYFKVSKTLVIAPKRLRQFGLMSYKSGII